MMAVVATIIRHPEKRTTVVKMWMVLITSTKCEIRGIINLQGIGRIKRFDSSFALHCFHVIDSITLKCHLV